MHRANWVWIETADSAVFTRARRCFEIAYPPQKARLRIAASGHYMVWLNGEWLGTGPARSSMRNRQYDIYAIQDKLVSGRNVLCVLAIHFAFNTHTCPGGPGGLWVSVDADEEKILSTDGSWQMSPHPCYDINAGRRNICHGLVEIYDARLEDSWLEPTFDDSDWQPARVYGDENSTLKSMPWETVTPRDIPMCEETLLYPARVVRTAQVLDQEYHPGIMGGIGLHDLGSFLLQDVPVEHTLTKVDNAAALVGNSRETCIISQPSPLDHSVSDRYATTIIVDFCREITAYPWIDVEGNEGAVVDLAYGEALIGGRVQAVLQNTSFADRYILRGGRQQHRTYDWKGFRYLQMTFRELTKPLKLHAVGAVSTLYPLHQRGSFECSDKKLNDIWRLGAYTQRMCTHDSVMDCPWREQRQFLGDGRLQLLLLMNAFGDAAMPRRFLRQFADEPLPSGLLPTVSPAPKPDYVLIDYCLWWVHALEDVLLFDGDTKETRRLLPHAIRILDWFHQFANPEGLLSNVPGSVFIDWAPVEKQGICSALNGIYASALLSASRTADMLDESAQASIWRTRFARLRESFHNSFWDGGTELYADAIIKGRRMDKYSQHTQCMAVLTGLCPVDKQALLKRALEQQDIVSTEPFFTYYYLRALSKADLTGLAQELTKKRWGAMLEAEATTCWEEWQSHGTFREGRWIARPRSHCHAWSAGPTDWLLRDVLGVHVDTLDPVVTIAPAPGELIWAEGTVPTRLGEINVAWRVDNGQLIVTVQAPNGARIELDPPAAYAGATVIERAGKDSNG